MKTVENGSTVHVHYKGIFSDGEIFDDSRARGQTIQVLVGNGVLLKGFVRIASTEILNVPTNVDGLPVYMSTTAGHFDFTAPSSSGNIVRIMGYAIDDDSGDVLVYFDPDKTWVEIA